MVKVIRQGVYYMDGRLVKESQAFMTSDKKQAAEKNTITYGILSAHTKGRGLRPSAVLFGACPGRDDVLRTLDFVGLKEFPLPTYLFGQEGEEFVRSAAAKWGGAFLTGTQVHACCTEQLASSGQLLYATEPVACGALGAMAVKVGHGELLRLFTKGQENVQQSELVALFLKGKPKKEVGPTDVALAILQSLNKAGGFARGKLLEVFGAGAMSLSMDFRIALDNALMCSGCLSTVWATDEKTQKYFGLFGREEAAQPLSPVQPAYYDGAVTVDLSSIVPMIAVEGKISSVEEFLASSPEKYLREGRVYLGKMAVAQGCATFETLAGMAEIVRGSKQSEAVCLCRPYSPATEKALSGKGYLRVLKGAGVELSPGEEELSSASDLPCLDAKTIAVTLKNGGYLTAAARLERQQRFKQFVFDPALHKGCITSYLGKADAKLPLAYDEGVKKLPAFPPLPSSLALKVDFGSESGEIAVLPESENYPWHRAVEDRERGAFAALAKEFSQPLRTHLIDWGILPLTYEKFTFKPGDVLHLNGIRELIEGGEERVLAKVVGKRRSKDIVLTVGPLTVEERTILLSGGKNNLVRNK